MKYTKDGGSNLSESEGLFSKISRERVTSNPDRRSGDGRLGLERRREREEVRLAQCSRWQGSMADGVEVAGARGTGARGHGSKNRGHRGVAGVLANPSRPRTGPVDAVGAVAAMAGEQELTGARE